LGEAFSLQDPSPCVCACRAAACSNPLNLPTFSRLVKVFDIVENSGLH